MSTVSSPTATTTLARLPGVNLLPPEIDEARRFRQIQLLLGAAVLGAVGVVGVLTILAANQSSAAQEDLDTATARRTTLQAKAAQYADVPVVNAQLDAAEAQLAQALGQEIRWSYFLNDLSLTVPGKVWLTSMTVTQTVDPVATAAVTDTGSYLPPGIGTVQFTGKGYRHDDVAAWLDALARQNGLTQPYFTSSTKEKIGDQDSVTFTSQATVTEEALSKRWTQKAGS